MLIPAAGSGTRMGQSGNKALLKIGGIPLIEHTVRMFLEHPAIERIHVIVRAGEISEFERILFAEKREKIGPLLKGGNVRQDSVWRGISLLDADPPDRVLIHDGARPFCSRELLERVLGALETHSAVVPVLPVSDTLRRLQDNGSNVVNRDGLYRTQTPQGFHWLVIREAFANAMDRQLEGTDDAQLVEAAGRRVEFVRGEERNLKVTNPEDMLFAEWVYQSAENSGL